MKHKILLAGVLVGSILYAPSASPTPAKTPDAPSEPSATFSKDVGESWIDYEGAVDHQIIIPVRVNGEVIRALVDTGSPFVAVAKDWADRHHLALTALPTTPSLSGQPVKQWQASVNNFDIGGFHQSGGSLNVVDLEGFNTEFAGKRIDMVIGMPFLSLVVTEVDFDHARIRFRLQGTPPSGGHTVLITIAKDLSRIYASLIIAGRRLDRIMIDTGDNSDLTVLKSAIGAYDPHWLVTDISSVGLGGKYTEDYARLNGVRWGSLTLENIPTSFDNLALGPGEQGSLGLELLERYNLYLDGHRNVMILTDRQNPPPPPHITNMGIQGNITDKGWIVVHVMRHSPAAFIGLVAGDRICSVDDRKLTQLSDIPRGPDGSVMTLGMCNGRKLKLTRRQFY